MSTAARSAEATSIEVSQRQSWMAVLARASAAEIEARLKGPGGLPAYEVVVAPQTGTVMVEGRAGGTGARFNLGEATMTKAVVRLADGTLGFSYALGRDRRKAVLAAVLDAALQNEARRAELIETVIGPLDDVQRGRRLDQSRRAAATKVEFFTLQRGEG